MGPLRNKAQGEGWTSREDELMLNPCVWDQLGFLRSKRTSSIGSMSRTSALEVGQASVQVRTGGHPRTQEAENQAGQGRDES